MDGRRLVPSIHLVVCVIASAMGFVFSDNAQAQWVVLHGKNASAARNIPAAALSVLIDSARKGAEVKCIAFAPNGGWVVLSGKNGFTARNIPAEALRILAEQQKKTAISEME